MIAVGDEGFFSGQPAANGWMYDGSMGGDFNAFLSLSHISFGTYHMYPDYWNKPYSWGAQYIQEHIDAGNTANKPVLMEEFGVQDKQVSNFSYIFLFPVLMHWKRSKDPLCTPHGFL